MKDLKLKEVHMMLGICVRYLRDRAEQERRDGPSYSLGDTGNTAEKNRLQKVQHVLKVSAFADGARYGECAYDSLSAYVPGFEETEDGRSPDELLERVAKFIHEDMWAHWMQYMLNVKAKYMDEDECFAYGQRLIEREDAERWESQMNTIYEDLSEDEKKSDRDLANKLLKLLEED